MKMLLVSCYRKLSAYCHSAVTLNESEKALNSLLDFLSEHPQITKVRCTLVVVVMLTNSHAALQSNARHVSTAEKRESMCSIRIEIGKSFV